MGIEPDINAIMQFKSEGLKARLKYWGESIEFRVQLVKDRSLAAADRRRREKELLRDDHSGQP